jgi:hypothetical protein
MAKEKDIFYIKVLQNIGALPTTNNVNFLKLWQAYEGGNAKYNPLNTTYKYSDTTNYNSVGVKNYASEQDGIVATYKTLSLNYYKPIVKALKENQPLSYYKNNPDISKSIKTWGTVHFADFLNKPSSQITIPSIETPSSETPSGEKKNWIKEHKKQILIGFAIASILTLAYYGTKKRV